MRRGLPTAHLVYGVPATINSANYYYFLVIDKILKISPVGKAEPIMASFVDGILRLHEGQAMDIFWRDNLIVPKEEEYLKMIELKTSTFFKTIYKPLAIMTDLDLGLDKLCNLIGIYFQIKGLFISI